MLDRKLLNIDYLVKMKEGQHFDRKSARIAPKDVVKSLIGFANSEGGTLAIGIEDKGKITGFSNVQSDKIHQLKQIGLLGLTKTPLRVESEEISVTNYKGEDDIVLLLTVNPEYSRVVSNDKDEVFLRNMDSTILLNYEQRLNLEYDRGSRYFEDEILEDSSIDDVDLELVEIYRRKMNISSERSIQDILYSRNLITKDGKLKVSGMLLFGKDPSRLLPQARLRFIKYRGFNAEVGTDFNVEKEIFFDKSIPRIIQEATDFVRTQLREFQFLNENGIFEKVWEYPEFAWFEGIVNALTHRDYSIRGDHIKVFMYEDKLEILSPGKLPNLVNINNIKNERYSRNPAIARILVEFGWVKELNEGVKRIYKEMENMLLAPPKYSEESQSKLKLTLENNILFRVMNIENKVKKRVSDIFYEGLLLNEKHALFYAYNKGKITSKEMQEYLELSRPRVIQILKKLESLDLLELHANSVTDSNQYYTFKYE